VLFDFPQVQSQTRTVRQGRKPNQSLIKGDWPGPAGYRSLFRLIFLKGGVVISSVVNRSGFPPNTMEFLQHYPHDLRLRWSAEDLVAQEEFARGHLMSRPWNDWSSEQMTLELLQA